jgi:hypothetical protein
VSVHLAPIAPIDVKVSTSGSASVLTLVLAPEMETCDRVWISLAYTDMSTVPDIDIAIDAYGCVTTREGYLLHIVCYVSHIRLNTATATEVVIGTLVDPGLAYGVHLFGYVVQVSTGDVTVREFSRLHAATTYIAPSVSARRRTVLAGPVYNVSSILSAYTALLQSLRTTSGDIVQYNYDLVIDYPSPDVLYVSRTAGSGVGVLVFVDDIVLGNYRIIASDGPSTSVRHIVRGTTHFVFRDAIEIQLLVARAEFVAFDIKAGPNATAIVAVAGQVTGATDFIVSDTYNVINADYLDVDPYSISVSGLAQNLVNALNAANMSAVATRAIFFPYHVNTYTQTDESSAGASAVIIGASVAGGVALIALIVALVMRARRDTKYAAMP